MCSFQKLSLFNHQTMILAFKLYLYLLSYFVIYSHELKIQIFMRICNIFSVNYHFAILLADFLRAFFYCFATANTFIQTINYFLLKSTGFYYETFYAVFFQSLIYDQSLLISDLLANSMLIPYPLAQSLNFLQILLLNFNCLLDMQWTKFQKAIQH